MLVRQTAKTEQEAYFDSLNNDPEELEEKSNFYKDLTSFYRRKWNCPLKIPTVNGQRIDLFRLYRTVISYGGWQKVSAAGKWAEVVQLLDIPDSVAAAEYALKTVYFSLLSRYEHQNLVGDERMDDDDLGRSTGRMSNRFSAVCPLARTQPLNDHARQAMGLPALRTAHGPYDRVFKSLLSGIPNEVDFAMNICTLLSHPSPRYIRLRHKPQLVDVLVAHVGLFNDDERQSLQPLYEQAWHQLTPHRQFRQFWRDCVLDADLRAMIGGPQCSSDEAACSRQPCTTAATTFNRHTDSTCFRVYQVASVLRNLSFDASNRSTLAHNPALLKFCLMCIHSRWPELQAVGLDILSNVANEMSLSSVPPVYRVLLFGCIRQCLCSDDKAHVMRACELVSGLCAKDANEPILAECLPDMEQQQSALSRIARLLCVKDIMLCVYVLECIYQLSEMGENLCAQLSTLPHVIDTLVSMVTIEAVSFGVAGLQGMKVVEYSANAMQQHHTAIMAHNQAQQQHAIAMRAQQSFVRPQSPAVMAAAATPPVLAEEQQQQQSVESLSVQWLHRLCKPNPTTALTRGSLYATYVRNMHDHHKSIALSMSSFTALVKRVFPSTELRDREDREGKTQTFIDGLEFMFSAVAQQQRAAQPTATAGADTASSAQQHPLIKSILATGKPNPAAAASGSGTASDQAIQDVVAAVSTVRHKFDPPSNQSDEVSRSTCSPMSSTSECVNDGLSSRKQSGTPLVNGLVESPAKTNGAVRLEICEEAQEAITFMKDTDKHEAHILRVENTSNTNGHAKPPTVTPQQPIKVESKPAPTSQIKVVVKGSGSEQPTANAKSPAGNTRSRTSPRNGLVNGHDPKTPAVGASNGHDTRLLNGCAADASDDGAQPKTNTREKTVSNVIDSVIAQSSSSSQSTTSNGVAGSDDPTAKRVLTPANRNTKRPVTTANVRVKRRRTSVSGGESNAAEAVVRPSSKTSSDSGSRPQSAVDTESSSQGPDEPKPSTSSGLLQYMCEWNGCGGVHKSAAAVINHVLQQHISQMDTYTAAQCKWPHCDNTARLKWALVTHVQDHHCSERALQLAAIRRHEMATKGSSNVPEPKPPAPHPGYSRNAAIEAIRRHALHGLQRDMTDDAEGPVTKSLRLTSSLVLRNLARYSTEARSQLRRHEAHLAWLALSRLESSKALAQCVSELTPHFGTSADADALLSSSAAS